MLSRLQAVLDRAHAGHRYISDLEQYGVPEHWRASLVGDCEDFAMACRELLTLQGIQSDLVLCRTEAGELHLVCSVDGYILDNRHRRVNPRQRLPYTWLSLGKPDGTWVEIIR